MGELSFYTVAFELTLKLKTVCNYSGNIGTSQRHSNYGALESRIRSILAPLLITLSQVE